MSLHFYQDRGGHLPVTCSLLRLKKDYLVSQTTGLDTL
jgi:hypothetical protein